MHIIALHRLISDADYERIRKYQYHNKLSFAMKSVTIRSGVAQLTRLCETCPKSSLQ